MSTDELVRPESKAETTTGSGIRWRQFGGMLAVTGVLTAGLVTLTAQGVLAANFSISGMPFTVAATHLHGDGFEQFATIDSMIEDSPNAEQPGPDGQTGGQRVVIVSAIDKAELTNLCQSVSLGGSFLKITAGDNKTPVKADSLVVDSISINGDTDFKNIDIGQDASTVDKVIDRRGGGGHVVGGPGVFSQQADTVDIDSLRQTNYATTASRFTLPHLRMSFTRNDC
ncbi:DUF6230 family protein [Actinoplanes sp. NPDC049265]|uniref:DUF6230 family protein n=1 Tax=Actinoplanes sp. NPDC049265 TaxID=3363902 RepID=UPI00370F7D26